MLRAIESLGGRAVEARRPDRPLHPDGCRRCERPRARAPFLVLLLMAAMAATGRSQGSGAAPSAHPQDQPPDGPPTVTEAARLRPKPKPFEPRFGQSVAIGGTAALIGSPIDTDVSAVGGSVHVFRDGKGGWRRMQRLESEDPKADDRFAASLAADGTWLVVGRDRADDSGPDAGAVAIYRRHGAHYRIDTTLEPTTLNPFDGFGSAVALGGTLIAVGAPRCDDAALDAGCVELFVHKSDRWQREARLIAPDAAASDWFGFSVAVADDLVCVGAYGDDDRGNSSGSVYAFRRRDGAWGLESKLVPTDLQAGDWFGFSLAAGRNLLAVGAPRDDVSGESAGCVRLLRRGTEGWEVAATLRPPPGSITTWFGYAVAIDGDRLLVGAPGDDGGARNGGAAFLYQRVRGDWTLRAILRPSEPESESLFGSSVALRGDLALVGRYPDEDGLDQPGSAWIYRLDRNGSVTSARKAESPTDPATPETRTDTRPNAPDPTSNEWPDAQPTRAGPAGRGLDQ